MNEAELFALPLEAFTAARNELSKQLKAGGDKDAARRVKSLKKPTVSAWAVNQLHWKHPAVIERLIRTAAVVREGLGTRGIDAAAAAEKRAALQSALSMASTILEEAGHGTAQATLRKVSTTLETVAARGGHDALGTLSEDLEPAGFDALAGMAAMLERAAARAEPTGKKTPTAPAKRPPPKLEIVAPQPDQDAIDDAEAAVEAALALLEVRRRKAARAQTEADQAALRVSSNQNELAEAKRRVAKAEKAVADATVTAGQARTRAAAAREKLADAEAAFTAHKSELAALKR